jgi:FkbM family methyltransferase
MTRAVKTFIYKVVLLLLKLCKTNPLIFAYKNIGILNSEDDSSSGEYYFITNYLKKYIPENGIFFDIGANQGSYTKLLSDNFPAGSVYSFEPNPNTFTLLKESIDMLNNVKIFNIGMGRIQMKTKLYTYMGDNISQHASVLKDVFNQLHSEEHAISFDINITSVDEFCLENNIKEIDFIKIDTEGYEYETLCGASGLLSTKMIKVIQFEFNEMNIISKIFLKDFYEILVGYKLYRLLPSGLISINNYDSLNEIFKFQNIIAIRDDLVPHFSLKTRKNSP